MYVSSVGYQEKAVSGENLGKEIKLERRFNNLEPVVVKSFGCILRRTSETTTCLTTISKCSWNSASIISINNPGKKDISLNLSASVFPNPVSRGSALQVKITPDDDERLSVALLPVSGQPVYRSYYSAGKGSNQLSVQVPQQLAAGVYMLVVKNETGKPVFTGRVVVE